MLQLVLALDNVRHLRPIARLDKALGHRAAHEELRAVVELLLWPRALDT